MKNYLPYVFPALAAAIVLFLAFRWYTTSTERGDITPFAEDVEIREFTDDESMMMGSDDLTQVDLEAEATEDAPATGAVRYEIVDDTVRLTVNAALPETTDTYQVWFKDPESDSIRRAFVLQARKGGYMGSAQLSADVVPFEVLVSREATNDDQPEMILLRGLIDGSGASNQE